jgi:tetratricopeptide (TPR) repeat protein
MKNKLFKEINAYLLKNELKNAIESLNSFVKIANLGEFLPAIEIIDQSYSSLLTYFIKGVEDKERDLYISKLKDDILSLNIQIRNRYKFQKQSDIYSIMKKNFIEQHPPFAGYSINENSIWTIEQIEQVLDMTLYLTSLNSKEELLFMNFMNAESVADYYKGLWVSLLTINAVLEFQWNKLVFLSKFVNKTPAIGQRAIVGLFLIMILHDEMMPFYEEKIREEIRPLVNSMNISELVVQFIRAQDTERIEKRINNDVLPDMMNQNDLIREKLNSLDWEDTDENPDWEELFHNSPEILDRLQEISEMQLEGNDTFMSAFRHLKSFSFFDSIPNWLMPFSAEHPALKELDQESPEFKQLMLDKLEKSFHICNSDKYSLLFNIKNMPSAQKDMIVKMMKAELSGIEEIAKDEAIFDQNAAGKHILVQYMQDLYRFFELSPWKNEFQNIFKSDIRIFKTTFSKVFLIDNSESRSIAEFYFVNKKFQNVVDGFEMLKLEPQKDIFEKMGYAYQQLKQYEKAVENYRKAELFDDESTWNRKKTAYCLKKNGKFDEALQIYLEVESLEPENINLLKSIAYTYLDMNDYPKALSYFQKMEKLNEQSSNLFRAISWCYFNLNEASVAKEYLNRIDLQDFTRHDYINMGHLEFVNNNYLLAQTFYKKSIALSGQGMKVFSLSFREDIPILMQYHISQKDILLMLESLRY